MLASAALGQRRLALATIVFLLACVAGLIHLLVGMDHVEESPLLGWGMLITACAQFAGGFAVLFQPSPGWARALLAGTALALAIFAVQYTVGVPSLEHGQPAVVSFWTEGKLDQGHPTDQLVGTARLAFANFVTELALMIVLLPLVLPPSERRQRGLAESL